MDKVLVAEVIDKLESSAIRAPVIPPVLTVSGRLAYFLTPGIEDPLPLSSETKVMDVRDTDSGPSVFELGTVGELVEEDEMKRYNSVIRTGRFISSATRKMARVNWQPE